jgi:hypothetical protein
LAGSYGVVTLGDAALTAAASDILRNPRITITANARADVEAARVDQRILALLETISRRYTVGVSLFKTGHSKYVKNSDRISNHYYGRAVDVSFVNGGPVSVSNLAARQVVAFLAQLRGAIQPDEVGHPFADFKFPGGFTDADHRGSGEPTRDAAAIPSFRMGFLALYVIRDEHVPARVTHEVLISPTLAFRDQRVDRLRRHASLFEHRPSPD